MMVNRVGTAGAPIIEILRKANLQNIIVIVTRYFGGILLGTGGLVKAYSTACKDAIESAELIQMKLCEELEVEISYNYHNILLHYFKLDSIIVKNSNFDDKIVMHIIVDAEKSSLIVDKIIEKTDRTAKVISKGTYYN